jgi:NAD(P) transhydrogenase subunit alpha
MENILEFVYLYRQEIFIIILASFLGIEVISNVPSVLHTPLMSGANAISGVIIIGGIILLGHSDLSTFNLNTIVGVIAIFLATLNVAGGFVVTDRMLMMFKKRKNKTQK